jgi:hypothetical protein
MRVLLLIGAAIGLMAAGAPPAGDAKTCDAKPFTLNKPSAQAPAPKPKPQTKVAQALKPPVAPRQKTKAKPLDLGCEAPPAKG